MQGIAAKRVLFVKKLPAAAWMHVQLDDLAKVVVQLATDGANAASFRGALGTRLHRAFGTPTPVAARVCAALETALPAEAAAWRVQLGQQLIPMLTAESVTAPLFDDVSDPESAIAAARALLRKRDTSQSVIAAKQFKANGRLDLAGAVFIACPNVFPRVEDVTTDLAKAICELPEWFRGPVDETLDCALRSLLCCVPALAKVYEGLQKMQTRRSAELALQRTALAHPALMLRRMSDMCAAAFAVLEGISDRNDRYHPHALFAVQTIFASIFSVQTEMKVRKTEVLEMGLLAKDLLLDEGRDRNGIPVLLAPFAVAVLQILGLYPKEVAGNGLGQVFECVLAASGTVDQVKGAISVFLGKLEA